MFFRRAPNMDADVDMAIPTWRGPQAPVNGLALAEHLDETQKEFVRGNYGAVYPYGEDQVVKVINLTPDFLSCDSARELVVHKLVRGVPNVSQMNYATRDEGHLYLFLRRQRGDLTRTLFTRKSPTRFDVNVHPPQLFSALCNMHARGVIHNDIKPENILLSGEGSLVLSDFGLSEFVNCGAPDVVKEKHTNPGCSAPEEYVFRKASKASDIYSLAVTLACCITSTFVVGINTRPLLDPHGQLAEVNRIGREEVAARIREERYGSLTPVTLQYLVRKFCQLEGAKPISAFSEESEMQVTTRVLDSVSIEFGSFINRMLSVDPRLRPDITRPLPGYTVPIVPRRKGIPRANFMRCFPFAVTKKGIEFLSQSVATLKHTDGVAMALTVDLATRFSHVCGPIENILLSEYLLLCLFIVENLEYSRFYGVDMYWTLLGGKKTEFDPLEKQIEILADVDFNIFTCSFAYSRNEFQGVSLEMSAHRLEAALATIRW